MQAIPVRAHSLGREHEDSMRSTKDCFTGSTTVDNSVIISEMSPKTQCSLFIIEIKIVVSLGFLKGLGMYERISWRFGKLNVVLGNACLPPCVCLSEAKGEDRL